MKINAALVNPFVEAGIKVIKELTNIDVRRGHLSIQEKPVPTYEVSIIIGIYGHLTGQVVYSMKKQVAVRLVQKILGEVNNQQLKEMFVDTLGEMANMITGNATALLSAKKDYMLKITTPAIVTGNQISVNLVPNPTVVLGMYTTYGPIEINIALEEAASTESGGPKKPSAGKPGGG
ncbi:MAG: chemotaxis protein CheX [Spirochaetaceae bacterium]|nr:MAG: chemotaxis protein CheX [Spirochaetaceae bacterium]